MMKNDPKPLSSEEKVALLLREIRDILKKKSTENNLFYDNADLKKLLNVSDSTLYRKRKAKEIPFKKICGKIFYPKSFFDKAFD